MTETTAPPEGKLLVDEETGSVLIADQFACVSRRYCETHSFIRIVPGTKTVFAGPDAQRRALARARNEGEAFLDAVELTIIREYAGMLQVAREGRS